MMRHLALLVVVLLLPLGGYAATLQADESVNVSISPAGNAYLAGTEVRVDAPLPGDLLAAAGQLHISASVLGDVLGVGGTVTVAAPITGDARVVGGRVHIDSDVGGELALFGGSIIVTGAVHEVRAAGGTVELRSGATGPVDIYGGSVVLGGEFNGNVRVFASDHLSLAEGTIIHGTLDYNAPQEAGIPPSALIDGGTNYVGSSSFLPTAEEARTFAIAGLGIFFAVRLAAAMLAAGLIAGLFPVFARRVVEETLTRSIRHFVLRALLGLCVFVVTPFLLLLLVVSFVGIGIAALLGALYVLLLLLAYLYAAVLVGSAVMRTVMKRQDVTWKGAVLGMGILGIIGLAPFLGFVIAFILSSAALGSMLVIFYRFAFAGNSVDA